jgi:hypothetical protein
MFRRCFNNFRHFPSHKILMPPQKGKKLFSTTIKKTRKWGKDEILTVGTWLIVGTGAFVLIGTTTSASVALLLANSLQFQGNSKEKRRCLYICALIIFLTLLLTCKNFRICCWEVGKLVE